MSKIGQKIIIIPESVKVEINGNIINVVGPKGEKTLELPSNLKIEKTENIIKVLRKHDDKKSKSLHGLYRKLIDNCIIGLDKGFEKKLDFKGVGFKAEVDVNKLILNVGFSHPVEIIAPETVEFKVEKNVITVSGNDAQVVGQVAANVRQVKPVEPYKGKGIKYIDEIPRRKPGKAAKAAIGSSGK
ncbi:MAG: ribosomal protein large subunit ribosomal protein [Candidatus Berkelbacteria bacterium]|nr:ribosomal protein large subunit ribosomal protein [Candidatus Berkelbacteria bacterium]